MVIGNSPFVLSYGFGLILGGGGAPLFKVNNNKLMMHLFIRASELKNVSQ